MNVSAGNQGKALLAMYDLGIATKPAYLYDKSKAHLLVTSSGRDRIGFIHGLCERISGAHGNVLDIKGYKVWPPVPSDIACRLLPIAADCFWLF